MIVRAITLAGGLAVGAGTSQFPEFSQQYAQRLGGAVDALSEVVADFDTSAAVEGLSRSEALEQMIGADFIERRRADMERTFDRHAVLTEDLRLLAEAGPFMRAYHAARFTDGDVASAAWDVFEPAVPLNLTSAIFAGFGFFVGLIAMSSLMAVIRWPFRRRTA
ncbi:MAG: DUF2937 family protein [Ascidiaceihabitans sp.]|jgi:hypothetical protein|nr:DUF2937 family protein [Ascidiaceihabitans sp.]